MSAPVSLKYRAFLSYAHADVRSGQWVHSQLERFHIDKDLAGRDTPIGQVPKSLRPIFRDREDFSGGHMLTDATIAALDASAALIVLCSTVAATRPAVNEEVRLFRTRHPDRLVIPVIVDGTYPDNFPSALRFKIAADGTVTDQPVTILGPDLRESGDGPSLALAKIVAGLIGVGTDEIVRRAEREVRRRMRNWVTGLSIVAISLAGLVVWAEINRREAVEQRIEATRNFAAVSLAFQVSVDLVERLVKPDQQDDQSSNQQTMKDTKSDEEQSDVSNDQALDGRAWNLLQALAERNRIHETFGGPYIVVEYTKRRALKAIHEQRFMEARIMLYRGQVIVKELATRAPEQKLFKRELSWFDDRIVEIDKRLYFK